MSREKVFDDPLGLFGSGEVTTKPVNKSSLSQTANNTIKVPQSESTGPAPKASSLFDESPLTSKEPAILEPTIFREIDTSKFLSKPKPKGKTEVKDASKELSVDEAPALFETQNTSGRGLGKKYMYVQLFSFFSLD